MARWLLMITVMTLSTGQLLSAATTDKYLTGWWHSLEIGSTYEKAQVNYRAPAVDSGNRIAMPFDFDQSIFINYSLQQHDLVRPGYYAGAYWGIGASLVNQSLSQDLTNGEFTYDSLMLIPRLQVGLSWRFGNRFMIQAGAFAGFGIDFYRNQCWWWTGSEHTALAYEHGFEMKARYSMSRDLVPLAGL